MATVRWFFSAAWALIGIGFRLDDIAAHTITIPSVGILLTSTNLTIASMKRLHKRPALTTLVGYTGILVALIGPILYIVAGVKAISDQNIQSATLNVTVGCAEGANPSYGSDPNIWVCSQLLPMQIVTQMTSADTQALTWWGLTVEWPIVFVGVILCWGFRRDEARLLSFLFKLYQFCFFFNLVGGVAVLAVAIESCKEQTFTVLDCQKAVFNSAVGGYIPCNWVSIIIPGSNSGYWDQWVRAYLTIAKSLFLW